MLPLLANAETVEVDSLFYNLISKAKVAEVTSNPNKYKGDIVIPKEITYDGKVYNVTNIGDEAFLNSPITSLIMPNSIKSIGKKAFQGCSKLVTAIISNNVSSIPNNAFSGCKNLISIIIPNGVTSIEASAFAGCISLSSVDIPNNVETIGSGAFNGCTNLSKIDIPTSLKNIESSTFRDCSSLSSINIPNGIISIGTYAFYGCNNLTSISLPSSITTIGAYAYYGCTNMESVNLPNNIKIINSNVFEGCSSLKEMTIPECVTTIESRAFYGCKNLTSIVIPNKVTTIGSSAFSGCDNLTTISIGKGVKTVGSKAFAECRELTDVYCYAIDVPNTQTDAFMNSYIEYATLHVDFISVEKYKMSEPWKNFNIILYFGLKPITVSVGSEGYATFCHLSNYEIFVPEDSPIQAYAVAPEYDNDPGTTNIYHLTGKLLINKINKLISSGEGVLIHGKPNTTAEWFIYENEYGFGEDFWHENGYRKFENYLIGTFEDIESLASQSYDDYELYNELFSINYILNVGSKGIGFYLANGQRVPAGKAYLEVYPDSFGGVEGAKSFIPLSLDEIVTDINNTTMNEKLANNKMYNMNGQRVSDSYKGLIITNGKKVIKK